MPIPDGGCWLEVKFPKEFPLEDPTSLNYNFGVLGTDISYNILKPDTGKALLTDGTDKVVYTNF